MKIPLINGLPIVSLPLSYKNKSTLIHNVLLDTGCSTTIFDTDLVEPIQLGLTKEPSGFDAILGVDFLYTYGLKKDFENLVVS